jgi:O-antigen/teichoic acid export membrane protein
MNLKRKPLITNIIWNFSSFFANLLISFFLARFILGQIGSVKYGIWVLVGSFLSYAGLMDLGFSTAIVQRIAGSFARGNREEIQYIITTGTSFFSLIGLLVFFFCFLFSAIDSSIFNVPLELGRSFSLLLIMLGGGVGFSFLGRVHLGILRALERFDIVNIIILIQLFFQLLLIILFLKHSIIVLGIIYAALNIAVNLSYMIATKLLLPDYRFTSVNFNLSTIQSLGGYGFFAFLIVLSDRFRFYTDSIILGHYLGATAITIFYFGNRIVEIFRDVLGRISGPFLPVFSRYNEAKNQGVSQESFIRSSRITAIFAYLIGGSLIVSGYPFLTVWIGDRLVTITPCYLVLVIITVPTTVALAQAISISFLYGTNRHKYLAYWTLLEGLANLILSILLVGKMGIFGVALGTAIPMIVVKGIFQPFYVCREIRISINSYLIKCMLIPLVISILYMILQLAAYHMVSEIRLVHLLLVQISTGTIISLIIYYFIFSQEDKKWIMLAYQNWRKK